MEDLRLQLEKTLKRDFNTLIEETEDYLKNYFKHMEISSDQQTILYDEMFCLFKRLEDDFKKVVGENDALKKENKEIKKYMLEYKNRLVKISNTRAYKFYHYFKRFFEEK